MSEIGLELTGEAPLTRREAEIARLVSQGLPNKAVAGQLGVQEGTIKVHLYNIYRKLGVSNRVGLIMTSVGTTAVRGAACHEPTSDRYDTGITAAR